jgi:[ribosomal protein S5]-alanine N-acetyltransferase
MEENTCPFIKKELETQFVFTNLLIESETLFIRPYQLEEVQHLFNVVSDPHFYGYIPETPPSFEEVANIIRWSEVSYQALSFPIF